jgi:putative ABC transport system permease protein
MDVLRNEFRLAIRRLLRARLVTLLALVTLALGIGANSAIFTVVNAILIRPLPFAQPDQLVRVHQLNRGEPDVMSAPTYTGIRERVRSLDLAVYSDDDATLTGGDGEPARLPGTWVSEGYFDVLGVRPLLGRTFRAGENEPGRERVILLSEGLWRQRYGGVADMVGKTVSIFGRPHTVVGVLPNEFARATGRSFWVPLEYDAEFRDPANFYALWLRGVGRLKPGVTLAQAQAELAQHYADLQRSHGRVNPRFGLGADVLHATLVKNVRTPLLLLLGAVSVVLLIACANLANLLLAQAAGRHIEFAVRRALGASRPRLILQLLSESLALAALGGVFGLLLGAWGSALLVRLQPTAVVGVSDITMDWRVVAFTAVVALLSAILFGLAPAVQVARSAPAATMREGGRGGVGSRRGNRLRNTLVVAETALAITLLVTAGLLLRSFARVQQVDPGFAPEQTLSFELQLSSAAHPNDTAVVQFYQDLLERIRALPGVRDAGGSSVMPLTGNNMTLTFQVAGREAPRPGEESALEIRSITPHYLGTIGVPLRRGRLLDERDRANSQPAVLISEVAATRYFKGEDPIGKTIELGWTRGASRVGGTVVGIVGAVRQTSLEQNPGPELYLPHAQVPFRSMAIVIRAAGDPLLLTNRVRNTVRELDRNLALANLKTLETVLDESVAGRRSLTLLLGSFAAVALLLAAVGIFGVISVMVAQRRSEIGVRMALGAAPGSVLTLIVGDAVKLAAAGALIGLIAAAIASRYLQSLLFEIEATDPLTFAATALSAILVSAAAAALPARSAARVDPNVALRSD